MEGVVVPKIAVNAREYTQRAAKEKYVAAQWKLGVDKWVRNNDWFWCLNIG